jgi:hypothetical protein
VNVELALVAAKRVWGSTNADEVAASKPTTVTARQLVKPTIVSSVGT